MTAAPRVAAREARNAAAVQPGAWLNVMPHIDPRFGGITSTVPPLCAAVERTGQPVSIAAFCQPDEKAPDGIGMALRIYPFGRFQLLPGSGFGKALSGQIAQSAGVHIHGLWTAHCALAGSLARKLNKPYIVSAHGMLDSWAVRNKAWKKRIYSALVQDRILQHANCLRALTLTEAEDYRRAGLRNPIAIVPNGIDLQPAADPLLFFAAHPELRGRRIALFLARLHKKKGLDLLCQAWAGIRAAFPDAHLVLAGPDCEGTQARIETLARELSIADRITFTGMISGEMKQSALAAAEFFVLPSYSEGFSVAVLEALGAGKPVVVTRQCNIPEVAEAGCGWVVEASARELENALTMAFRMNPVKRTVKGEMGRKLVEERFSWPRVGRQMSEIYAWASGGAMPESVRIMS